VSKESKETRDMRALIPLIIVLGLVSNCHAEEMDVCHESVVLVKKKLQIASAPEQRAIYELAFGQKKFSQSEIRDFQQRGLIPEVLAILAQEDHANRLDYLLHNGLDPNLQVPGGAPVLVAAVECKNISAIDALIKSKANLQTSDSQSVDAMAMAIIVNSTRIVDILLASGYMVRADTKEGSLVLRLAKKMHGGVFLSRVQARVSNRGDDVSGVGWVERSDTHHPPP